MMMMISNLLRLLNLADGVYKYMMEKIWREKRFNGCVKNYLLIQCFSDSGYMLFNRCTFMLTRE